MPTIKIKQKPYEDCYRRALRAYELCSIRTVFYLERKMIGNSVYGSNVANCYDASDVTVKISFSNSGTSSSSDLTYPVGYGPTSATGDWTVWDSSDSSGTTASWTTKYIEDYIEFIHDGFWKSDVWERNRPDPKNRLAEIIRKRQGPAVHVNNDRRQPLKPTGDIREQRARETMRRVLGDREYRRFMKHGFVSVKGKTGLVYQIFPGHNFTCVFEKGKLVDRLCVVLRGNFPPTDSLMMRYLMILNNEEEFRKYAIQQSRHSPKIFQFGKQEQEKSLVEIYRELKAA